MFLDDDDVLAMPETLEKIAQNGKDLILWKVDLHGKIIPTDLNFGKSVELYDVTGIGFAFHINYVKFATWSEWKRGDYRVAKALFDNVESVGWIDSVLTKTQGNQAGFGVRKDINFVEPIKRNEMIVKFIKNTTKSGIKLPYHVGHEYPLHENIAREYIRKGLCIDPKAVLVEPEPVLPVITEPEAELEPVHIPKKQRKSKK